VAVAVAVVLGAGCQVDVAVEVDVDGDGSGTVEVAAALDEEAAARVPELADQLEVDDLEATGWTVTGPAEEDDGRTWVRASKPFATVEEAPGVLEEVSGPGGPFRDLRITRSPSLLVDTWRFQGTADLTAGLAAFSDDALRARLDGTDVGLPAEELAATAGRPLDEVFTFRVAVDLPGRVSSDGEAAGGRATWHPRLGEELALSATGRRLNLATAGWSALAGLAVAAAGALAVARARRNRRR
jgi:hypothetical protein